MRGPPERAADERDDESNIGDEETAYGEDREHGAGNGGAGGGQLRIELEKRAARDGKANWIGSEDREAHEEAGERGAEIDGGIIVEDEAGARATKGEEAPGRHRDGHRADDAERDGSYCGAALREGSKRREQRQSEARELPATMAAASVATAELSAA